MNLTMYVQTDTYAFSIDLAQRNRKNTSLNIRFAFCVNLGLAFDLQGGLWTEESRVKLEKRPTHSRRKIEPWRFQKAIVRFGLNLKKTTIKRDFQIRITNKTIAKALTNQCGH